MEQAFLGDDPRTIHDALISAAYWDQDWKWAQDKCLEFAKSPSEVVRAGAAYAFGLIAVFHAKLEMDAVLPVLEKLREDPATRPYAEGSLEVIHHFIVTLKGKCKAKRLPPGRHHGDSK